MNWYRKTQLNKEAGLREMGKTFLGLTIPAIALLLGLSIIDIENKIETNPQEIVVQIEQKQTENTHVNKIENRSENINLDKIIMIESSGGKNNWNPNSRARGPFQFMEETWNDCVNRMGKDWKWWNDSMDLTKSRIVADYYYNTRIPQMLNYFNIKDTIETRIGAYDWGIGYLKNVWDKYGETWLSRSPSETKDYIMKYRGL